MTALAVLQQRVEVTGTQGQRDTTHANPTGCGQLGVLVLVVLVS